MDNHEKYRKIRRRLESVSFVIALIVGNGISLHFGIYCKRIISFDTALNLAIVLGISFVLDIFAIRIADKWYAKNSDK